MKKKTILTSIFVLYTILLLLGTGVSIPAEAQSAILNNSVSTTFGDDYPNFSKIAMKPEKNFPFNVHIEGDQPGVFSYVDFENTTIPGGDFSTTHEKGYPTSLGTLEQWSNNPVDNPWDIEWLHVSNDDLESGESASYNVTLSSLPLGSLSPGVPTEYDTLVCSDYRELELIVDTIGLYVLYYDSETTLSSLHLISANGTEIDIVDGNLPAVSGSGIPVRKFLTFMADTAGSYRMFFKTNTRYISFELDEISLTSEIEIGERIIYKDEDYEDIDPKSLQGSATYFPIQYYSFPVSAGDYLRINFALVWGDPKIRLISPTSTGYDFSDLADTAGDDSFQRFSYSGIAYIAVLHNMYFNWQWPYAVTKEPLYYKFGVYDEGIPTYPYELGTSEVFNVDPIVQSAIIEFNLTEPTSIHLNYSIHQGGAGVYTPSNDFFLVQNDTGFNSINSIASGSIDDRYYDLVPGIYRIFIHSTSLLQTDVIEFQSKILTRDGVHHKSFTKLDDELMKSDTTQMESSYFYATNTLYSTLYPSTIPFSYDDSIGFGYNISINPTDNPSIFKREMPTSEIQVWLWNGTEYINQTYNPNALDLFIDGSATGHYPYFGAVRQFDKIQFNLHNLSSSLNYTWQCLENSGWEDLNILTDGTNATGSTLSQSGLISFEFTSSFLNDVNDPDGGGDMPDVNKSMYWFRLECSINNPTSIPAISGYSATPPVQMYRYTELTVEMYSEINLVSKFDNITHLQEETQDDTLGITSFSDLDSLSYYCDQGGENGLFGTGDAIMSIWPYEVYEHDFYLGTQVKIVQNVNFRIATFDDVGRYIFLNYPSIGSNPTNLTALNFSTYNTYGYSGSFNESNFDGVVLSIEGELYDWYQFIFQSDNTANSIDVGLLFDNIWPDNNGPTKANTYAIFGSSSNSNNSAELGIGPSQFKFVFVAQADNSSELVEYRLNIASYGVQLLTPNLTLIPSHFETGVPSWVLPASIGGGVTIIAIVGGVVIYKKKHPV